MNESKSIRTPKPHANASPQLSPPLIFGGSKAIKIFHPEPAAAPEIKSNQIKNQIQPMTDGRREGMHVPLHNARRSHLFGILYFDFSCHHCQHIIYNTIISAINESDVLRDSKSLSLVSLERNNIQYLIIISSFFGFTAVE
jgi:hypothetical protein